MPVQKKLGKRKINGKLRVIFLSKRGCQYYLKKSRDNSFRKVYVTAPNGVKRNQYKGTQIGGFPSWLKFLESKGENHNVHWRRYAGLSEEVPEPRRKVPNSLKSLENNGKRAANARWEGMTPTGFSINPNKYKDMTDDEILDAKLKAFLQNQNSGFFTHMRNGTRHYGGVYNDVLHERDFLNKKQKVTAGKATKGFFDKVLKYLKLNETSGDLKSKRYDKHRKQLERELHLSITNDSGGKYDSGPMKKIALKFKGNELNDNFQEYTIKNLLKMYAKHNRQKTFNENWLKRRANQKSLYD